LLLLATACSQDKADGQSGHDKTRHQKPPKNLLGSG